MTLMILEPKVDLRALRAQNCTDFGAQIPFLYSEALCLTVLPLIESFFLNFKNSRLIDVSHDYTSFGTKISLLGSEGLFITI
jgi:hypothetical protein